MVPAPPRALEILEEAIHHEQSSHDYYLKVAAAIESPARKERYRRLAHEEIRHREALEERWRALTGKRFRYEPSRAGAGDLPVPSSDATALEALELAMEHELEAADNYRELAEGAGSEESRRVYLELARDEQRHYEWFRDQRDELQRGARWFPETLSSARER